MGPKPVAQKKEQQTQNKGYPESKEMVQVLVVVFRCMRCGATDRAELSRAELSVCLCASGTRAYIVARAFMRVRLRAFMHMHSCVHAHVHLCEVVFAFTHTCMHVCS